MTKREVKKKVREIIRCLEHSGDLPEQDNCIKVAERKLEMLVKEAPASVSYELGCIHGQLKSPGGDAYTAILRLRKILKREVKMDEQQPDGKFTKNAVGR